MAVGHWKYGAKSSGGLQTIAALKSYGLMEDAGKGPDRKVRLTEVALRILLDTRPDSQERVQLLSAAATAPAQFAEIHRANPDGLPSTATLRHYLIFDKRFTESAADEICKILLVNQAFISSIGGRIEADNVEMEKDQNLVLPSQIRPAFARPDSEKRGWQHLSTPFGATERQIAEYPVGPDSTVRLVARGPISRASISKLIALLELNKEDFPEKIESEQTVGTE